MNGVQKRVRHKATGGEYEVLGDGKIQTTKPLLDMDAVAIYRAKDGSLWARDKNEFEDGRFENIP